MPRTNRLCNVSISKELGMEGVLTSKEGGVGHATCSKIRNAFIHRCIGTARSSTGSVVNEGARGPSCENSSGRGEQRSAQKAPRALADHAHLQIRLAEAASESGWMRWLLWRTRRVEDLLAGGRVVSGFYHSHDLPPPQSFHKSNSGINLSKDNPDPSSSTPSSLS